MSDEEKTKTKDEKGANQHKSWLFWSKNVANKSSGLATTILIVLLAAFIITIVILAALGKLPNIGGNSSLSVSSSLS